MGNLLLRFLITAAAIAVIASINLAGIHIQGDQLRTLAVIAVIFGLINTIIKPIVKFFTCPLILLTLGLFTFVINAAMLLLTAQLSETFMNLSNGVLIVPDFGAALVGAFVISVVSFILESALGVRDKDRKRTEVRTVKEVRYVVERPAQPGVIEQSNPTWEQDDPFDKPKRG